MKSKKKAAVFDLTTGQMKCLKCNETRSLNLPLELAYAASEMKTFSKIHNRCYLPIDTKEEITG